MALMPSIQPATKSAGMGIVSGCAANVLLLIVLLAALRSATVMPWNAVSSVLAAMASAIGLTQFAIMGPLIRFHRRSGDTEMVKGLKIATGITFMLNAGCWGNGLLWR